MDDSEEDEYLSEYEVDAYGVVEVVVGHNFLRSDLSKMEEREIGVVNVDHHSHNSIQIKETTETKSLSRWNPMKQHRKEELRGEDDLFVNRVDVVEQKEK